MKQSPHQVLYNLYNTISLAELKANIVLQFSYLLLKLYEKGKRWILFFFLNAFPPSFVFLIIVSSIVFFLGNFTLEAQLALSKYEERYKQKNDVIIDVLMNADRSLYKCDPKQHVEGVTYVKLTKLLQGYIENEVNLNGGGSCSENCGYYEYTEYNGCYHNQFCSHQPPCRGKVLNCKFVDSDMTICRSSVRIKN